MTLKQTLEMMLSKKKTISSIDKGLQHCECFGEGVCKRGMPRNKMCFLCRYLSKAKLILCETALEYDIDFSEAEE